MREAKRLVGDWVWTEHVPPAEKQQRSIGLGAYSFDCHWVSLYDVPASTAGGKTTDAHIVAEGRVNQGRDGENVPSVTQPPYRIPYDALLPKEDPVLVECTASVLNVQLPLERCQEWEAIKGGGFERTG